MPDFVVAVEGRDYNLGWLEAYSSAAANCHILRSSKRLVV